MSAVTAPLSDQEVYKAVGVLSLEGRWHYTARNLFYELIRSGCLPNPAGDGGEDYHRFTELLAGFERSYGPLEKLIRPEFLEGTFSAEPLSADLLTYAVKRVMVFERPELLLLFARNHFFMKLECILLSASGAPNHVSHRVDAQLEAGMPMDFFAVHDATVDGYEMYDQVVETYGKQPGNTVQQTALTFDQTHDKITIRCTGQVRPDIQLQHSHPEDAAHLAGGHYFHLEEISPLILMRLVYNRTVGRFDEMGFG